MLVFHSREQACFARLYVCFLMTSYAVKCRASQPWRDQYEQSAPCIRWWACCSCFVASLCTFKHGKHRSYRMVRFGFASGIIVCFLDVACTTALTGTFKQQQHAQSVRLALSTVTERYFFMFLVV